jgi:sec-independent protein translocase protein TatC
MSEAAPQSPSPDPEKASGPEDEVRATFFEHLQELRVRLVRALLGVAVGMAAIGYWSEDVYRWLMKPVISSLPASQQHLNYTSYLEPFMVYLKVALYGGIFVAAPWVLWQIWLFVAPGLYKREKKVVVPFLAFGTALFYAGGAFCYFLVMPYAFPALNAIAGADMVPILTMKEQLTLSLAMMLGFGVVFEVPVILGFLSMVGLVSADFLARYRRVAIIANVVLAAIITPTGDPFNLALMAVPMILFYEIGVLLARILGKKPAAAPAET